MQTSLRKMGNSTGMIVPRAVLTELGVASGATMEISVVDGKIVAIPVSVTTRAGWADAAAEVADAEDGLADWRAFGNDDDSSHQW